jgi:hypothetical protein
VGCKQRGEEIALEEADARVDAEAAGVVAGDGEGRGRDVDGSDVGVLEDGGESNGDGTGTSAYVGNAEVRASFGLGIGLSVRPVEDGFDEVLGLGARNEDVGGDAEGEAEELLRSGEMLERFLLSAAGDDGAEGVEVKCGKVVVGMGEQPGTVSMEDVREQGFGVAAGDGGGGFEESVAKSHAVERIALPCFLL